MRTRTGWFDLCGFSEADHQGRRAGTLGNHFIDAVDTMGHFLELYEPSPSLVGFYDLVRAAADQWDGQDPVRDA